MVILRVQGNARETATIGTIVIEKIGECNRCGWCCGACIHLESPNLCKIYEKRKELGHENCMSYPDLPIHKLNPKCGYKFILRLEGETDKVDGRKSGREVVNIEFE
jgi:hypothetical protein